MSTADIGNLPPRATFGLETIRNFFFNIWLRVRDGLRAAGGRVRRACEGLGACCTRGVGENTITSMKAKLGMAKWEKMTDDVRIRTYRELVDGQEAGQARHDADGSEAQY